MTGSSSRESEKEKEKEKNAFRTSPMTIRSTTYPLELSRVSSPEISKE